MSSDNRFATRFAGLSGILNQQTKRKVFISFHHANDWTWFEQFKKLFSSNYEVFYDQSVDGSIRSNDTEYVNRRIREEFIKGSSVTVVLCGAETWKRKYVDWEIYSTLHLEHAVLGIILPSVTRGENNSAIVADRLHENIVSGYIHHIDWTSDPAVIKTAIEEAIRKSSDKSKIINSREKMSRNVS